VCCASVLEDWGPQRPFILPQQAWEQLASSTSTTSIFPICSGKYFTGQRTSAAANWNQRETDCATSIRISTSNCINADSPVKMRRKLFPNTTLSWMGQIISPRVTCPTTSVFSHKSQMCMALYFVSKGRRPYLRHTSAAHVIAAFFQSHLHRSRSRTARKRACSVYCQESSACCRRSKRSS
jgi:hypothetical protein